jgi:hypothetical protein
MLVNINKEILLHIEQALEIHDAHCDGDCYIGDSTILHEWIDSIKILTVGGHDV